MLPGTVQLIVGVSGDPSAPAPRSHACRMLIPYPTFTCQLGVNTPLPISPISGQHSTSSKSGYEYERERGKLEMPCSILQCLQKQSIFRKGLWCVGGCLLPKRANDCLRKDGSITVIQSILFGTLTTTITLFY